MKTNSGIQEISLTARYIDTLGKGLFKSVREQLVAILLSVATLVYQLWHHEWALRAIAENVWAAITPWIWIICGFVVWHVFKAAILLDRDIRQATPPTYQGLIILTDGTQAKIASQYRLKLLGVAATCVLALSLVSYLVWSAAHPRIEGRVSISEQLPPQSDSATHEESHLPAISILGYEVILFKPNTNPFANVFVQNVGSEGTITVYSSSGLSLIAADPRGVKKELESTTKKLVSEGGGLAFSIKAQEKRWFTVMGPILSPQQAKQLKAGRYFFYFAGTILLNGSNSNRYDFCSFVSGDRPNVILQCPEK